jgi:hypothetical protein
MEIAISLGFVAIAIVVIAGLGFWLYRRRVSVSLPVSENDTKATGDSKPKVRIMTEEEIRAWEEMEIPTNDIRILEAARGTVIMPSDLDRVTNELNAILKKEGFGFTVAPVECLGCQVDQLNFYKTTKKHEPLPIVALFRHANRIIHRKHQLDVNFALKPDQVNELNQLIKDLADEANARKSGLSSGVLKLTPAAVEEAPKKPKIKPVAAKSVEELAKMEANFQTRKIIAEQAKAGKVLSEEEQQAIFAEQWKIALAKCRKKYGG